MGQSLKDALANHYDKEQSAYRFHRSGLNQGEMAVAIGVDPAHFSKVLRGKERRLLTPEQLDRFREVEELTKDEHGALVLALESEYRLRDAVTGAAYRTTVDRLSRQTLDLAAGWQWDIYLTRVQGDPRVARAQAVRAGSKVAALRTGTGSGATAQRLSVIQAQILFEGAYSGIEIASRSSVVSMTDPQVSRIADLAATCSAHERDNVYGASLLLLADANYVAGNYIESAKLAEDALKYLTDVDRRLLALRVLATDLAHLGNKKAARRALSRGFNLVEGGNWQLAEALPLALQGFARAQYILRDTRSARDTLGYASAACRSLGDPKKQFPVRYIQLVRTILEVYQGVELSGHDPFITSGADALRLARRHGYPRAVDELDRSLRSFS